MKSLLLSWLINTITLMLVVYIVPGIQSSGLWTSAIAALVLGLLNALIRPFVILITLPINILTLGLFTLIINGFFFLLASKLVSGFEVRSFWWAVLGALVFSVISSIINWTVAN